MHSNDPQTTLLNLDCEEFTTKYYSNVEPWDGNYDLCLHQAKQELPKKVRQIRVPQTRSRRRSIEITPLRQESCPRIEAQSSFQMTYISPRKNSTQQYKQNCLKTLFPSMKKKQQMSWAEYFKFVQKNHNQPNLGYNLVGYNIQLLKSEERSAIFQNFRMKLKSQGKAN